MSARQLGLIVGPKPIMADRAGAGCVRVPAGRMNRLAGRAGPGAD